MRVTEQVLATEAIIGSLLTDARGWTTWHAEGGQRKLYVPSLVACHPPSRLVVAVFVRPRKLYPSERPSVAWLPADWLPVVWHPGMAAEVRAWLAYPHGQPPGYCARNGTP